VGLLAATETNDTSVSRWPNAGQPGYVA